LRPFD
jgi:putative transposase